MKRSRLIVLASHLKFLPIRIYFFASIFCRLVALSLSEMTGLRQSSSAPENRAEGSDWSLPACYTKKSTLRAVGWFVEHAEHPCSHLRPDNKGPSTVNASVTKQDITFTVVGPVSSCMCISIKSAWRIHFLRVRDVLRCQIAAPY